MQFGVDFGHSEPFTGSAAEFRVGFRYLLGNSGSENFLIIILERGKGGDVTPWPRPGGDVRPLPEPALLEFYHALFPVFFDVAGCYAVAPRRF